MLGIFMYIFEIKKELIIGVSLTILYITYYLVEVVKKPVLICREGEFRRFLEQNVPILKEYYWPTPWCVESRLQTVLGSILRSRLLPPLKFRREVLRLSDGGQVALDWVEEGAGGGEARAVLLVLPGLTGSADADYVRCVAAAARSLRARCVVFNNRGLGGLALSTPRLYCAVSHSDLAEVVRRVRAAAPGVPLLAAGVSLGGLILGHYLAEHGDAALVHAALVVSSPLDVVKGSECMERPPFNALLSYHMARNLRNTVRAHAWLGQPGRLERADRGGVECADRGGVECADRGGVECADRGGVECADRGGVECADRGGMERVDWGGVECADRGGMERVDWGGVERARSVREFDAAFTTKHFGFASVGAYYRAASLRHKLARVRVPLLCLCAADDPFQPLSAIPAREAEAAGVALLVTARGGHIGFLEGWWPARAAHDQYIARCTRQYFAALLDQPARLHAC